MSQNQDKNKSGEKEKWYQNNWFIMSVSVVMIALLVFSLFLGNQWNKFERTIFGNKVFYYKMEMNNFSKITRQFSSAIDYSYESQTTTKGVVELGDSGKSIFLDINYHNDDEEKLTKLEMSVNKNRPEVWSALSQENLTVSQTADPSMEISNERSTVHPEMPIAELELYVNNNGIWAEFPTSGYATNVYKVGKNLSRIMFKPEWFSAINNSDVSWAIYDMLQAVNNVVPDEKVFHYDEVEFDGKSVHKIEFVMDEQTQQNMKNALLACLKKKEIGQVIDNVEEDLKKKLDIKEEQKTKKANNQKTTRQLYKLLKQMIDGIPCDRGDMTYNVLYDDDQNILSRELLMQDNRIQVLSYTENGELVLTFFNEKLGLNIENKCKFNSGVQQGVEGRLIIDSGADELGVIYKCREIIGGVVPVGEFEVLAGRTGVAEVDSGAIPVWKADYILDKEEKKVSFNFMFEKNQSNVFKATGNFVVDDLKKKIPEKVINRTVKVQAITDLSWQKLLSETVWNYTLSK